MASGEAEKIKKNVVVSSKTKKSKLTKKFNLHIP
jgi:hypothetical protein